MNLRWVRKPQADQQLVDSLSKELNIHPVLAQMLIQRGHDTFDKAKIFFRPQLNDLHDPFLMKDMDLAIERINAAMSQGEKILIYGDYDVDGTTAVALVYTYLHKQYDQLDFYIPNRYTEGYGISTAGIDWAHENGFSLIIALDCGIKSIEKIDYAKSKGIDFIICDHHRPGNELPNAVAVLDPKRNDCAYPFKELSGCGVGYKLIQALTEKNNRDSKELYEYLDLVAISIAADIVPIMGENRILAYYGLQSINQKPRPGIQAILNMSGCKGEISVNEVVFSIAPRINAAGRMASGRQAVELLIAQTDQEAFNLGGVIDENNTKRKGLNESITKDALDLIRGDEDFSNRKSTVLFNPGWSKGVIGIVAAKLTDEFYRPTIILTEHNGLVSGSARSVKDFDVYNAIEQCSDLLEQFGGHMYAAGLTLKPENVDLFKERFEEVVSSTIEDYMLTREIEIDDHVRLDDLTPAFYSVLKQFAPFGPGNMSPIFVSENVVDKGSARIVGNNHLKLVLRHHREGKTAFDGIAFQMGKHYDGVVSKRPFHVCYHLEENNFKGRTTLQLNVKDISFAD
jgi:single-stranded-DNA-specific exonuclease